MFISKQVFPAILIASFSLAMTLSIRNADENSSATGGSLTEEPLTERLEADLVRTDGVVMVDEQ